MSMILLSAIHPELLRSGPIRRQTPGPGRLRPTWRKRLENRLRAWRIAIHIGHTRYVLCW